MCSLKSVVPGQTDCRSKLEKLKGGGHEEEFTFIC